MPANAAREASRAAARGVSARPRWACRQTVSALSLGCIVTACAGMGDVGMGTTTAVDQLACPELGGGAASATFAADARANATIRAFVTASGDLATLAARAEAEVGSACANMARDLGVDVTPQAGENPVAVTCNAVSARMDAILQQGASGSIRAEVVPPRCDVSADAAAACDAQCNVSVDPGYVKAHCAPGHLYGRCEGNCDGQCTGTCSGECQGECAGQAAASPGAASGHGQCAGQCRGTCRGSCSADCHGSCSVELQEPKCDVAIQAPSADARCSGSCKAHANLTARCTDAKVDVKAGVSTGDLPKLAATLRANLPTLVRAELAYGNRISADVETLVRAGAELPNAFGQLTGHAGACLAAAANACLSAQASLRISVQASASISGKAGVRGTAG
jgi:hypothetical protein